MVSPAVLRGSADELAGLPRRPERLDDLWVHSRLNMIIDAPILKSERAMLGGDPAAMAAITVALRAPASRSSRLRGLVDAVDVIGTHERVRRCARWPGTFLAGSESPDPNDAHGPMAVIMWRHAARNRCAHVGRLSR